MSTLWVHQFPQYQWCLDLCRRAGKIPLGPPKKSRKSMPTSSPRPPRGSGSSLDSFSSSSSDDGIRFRRIRVRDSFSSSDDEAAGPGSVSVSKQLWSSDDERSSFVEERPWSSDDERPSRSSFVEAAGPGSVSSDDEAAGPGSVSVSSDGSTESVGRGERRPRV